MRTFLIAAILAAFTGQVLGQTSNGSPSYAPHRKAKTPLAPNGDQNPKQTPSQPAPVQTPPPRPASPQATPNVNQAQGSSGSVSHDSQQTFPITAPPDSGQSVQPIPKVPAAAPRVSYQNGELTVLAQNSSLSEILNAVRIATGVKIEGLTGSPERVTAKIGPAPVRDVLLSLLEGSRYDFAMLGAADDPQRLERLVLSPRMAANGSSPSPGAQPPQNTAEAPAQPGDDDDDSEGFAPAKPAPGAAPPAAPAAGQVKTPEQLLEDLKKLEAEKAQQQNTQPTSPNGQRPARPERPK